MARTSTKPLSKLGRIIAKGLKDQDITGAAVAKAASIHPTTLWRWMTGSGGPRADQAAALAKALGISTDLLLSSMEKPPRKKITARS